MNWIGSGVRPTNESPPWEDRNKLSWQQHHVIQNVRGMCLSHDIRIKRRN